MLLPQGHHGCGVLEPFAEPVKHSLSHLTRSLSLSLSLSHAHTHTQTLTLTLTRSRSHSRAHSHTSHACPLVVFGGQNHCVFAAMNGTCAVSLLFFCARQNRFPKISVYCSESSTRTKKASVANSNNTHKQPFLPFLLSFPSFLLLAYVVDRHRSCACGCRSNHKDSSSRSRERLCSVRGIDVSALPGSFRVHERKKAYFCNQNTCVLVWPLIPHLHTLLSLTHTHSHTHSLTHSHAHTITHSLCSVCQCIDETLNENQTPLDTLPSFLDLHEGDNMLRPAGTRCSDGSAWAFLAGKADVSKLILGSHACNSRVCAHSPPAPKKKSKSSR